MLTITATAVEYQAAPVGVGEPSPRFSWGLAAARNGATQRAYELEVRCGTDVVWSTGRVDRDEHVHVPYAGDPLQPSRSYEWAVRVWDDRGLGSEWSAPATFETGLAPDGWDVCAWIAPPGRSSRRADRPSPLLRRSFHLARPVVWARLSISALGLHDAAVNGASVTADRLRPGFTAYDERLQFQTYDVAHLLRTGDNAIGITLADGWWRGRVGVFRRPNNWGREVAAIARLDIRFDDDTTDVVVTDQRWRTATGGVQQACLFHGETFDARLEPVGWSEPGFDDSRWESVRTIAGPTDRLCAQIGPSVRPVERRPAQRLFTTPSGQKVVDFGQNLAGVTHVRVRGRAGDEVRLIHGETLTGAGDFTAETFGESKQQTRYLLRGDAEGEEFEPRFTYHGFRYVEVESWPEGSEPSIHDFEAVVLSSDCDATGSFTCSHPGLDQLVRNIDWSQRSNFVDVPTDCPTREKAGWTGDIAMFARTALFNRNVAPLLAKWLADVRADQLPDGRIPCVVPVSASYNAPFMKPTHGAAAWSDACVLVPWTMYEFLGDRRVLAENYETMRAWVGALELRAARDPWWAYSASKRKRSPHHDHVIEQGFQWAEWLPPGETLTKNWLRGMFKPDPLIATAYYANTLDIVGRVAALLGHGDDAQRLSALRAQVVEAARAVLFDVDGLPRRRDQIGLTAALALGLVADDRRAAAGNALAAAVRANGNRLATGFTMTPLLCPTLVRTGYAEVAYDVLLQQDVPSWLYPISKGATTTWETWDAIAPDGTVSKVSQNHYAFGAIGEFLHRFVAGLDTDPEAPGFERIVVAPVLDPQRRITSATAALQTPRGRVSTSWQLHGDEFSIEIGIPPSSTAVVRLPDGSGETELDSGVHTMTTTLR